MAIYHYSVKIIKRSQGRSSVGAAAYRAGARLTSEYDGMTHDYTRKHGIMHSEIMLPANAPASFSDRQTLWNSVELAEKSKVAQLARDVELSLPVELNLEEQINLVRGYVQRAFVDRGMVADFSIHDIDTGNPHAHIMLTVRALDEHGGWLPKKRKEYILDAAGNKQYDPKKKSYKCNTITTTDWNEHSNMEVWREQWAAACNRVLEQKGLAERIDHRSYARQGIEREPTVHLGYVASSMEKQGKPSERGDINREIAASNARYTATLQELKDELKKLEQAEPIAAQLQPVLEVVAENINALQDKYMRQHLVILEQAAENKKLDNAAWEKSSRYDTATELLDQARSMQEQRKEMESRLSQLGMFAGKEKKTLAGQIENVKTEWSQIDKTLGETYGITPQNMKERIKQLEQEKDAAIKAKSGQPDIKAMRQQHSATLEQFQHAVKSAVHRPDAVQIFDLVKNPKSHYKGQSITKQLDMSESVNHLRDVLLAAQYHLEPERKQKHRHERGGMEMSR